MNELPCITNKCILYPVCRNKTYIDCDHIKEYFKQALIHKQSYRETYKQFNKILPFANKVKKGEKGNYNHYIKVYMNNKYGRMNNKYGRMI